jgi:hypothetical protein|tara:strand:- start:1307 stop:1672 length:366 start_codon:yes stop_codon:yes gene_type:complete
MAIVNASNETQCNKSTDERTALKLFFFSNLDNKKYAQQEKKRDTKTRTNMSQSYSSPIQFLSQSPLSVYLRDRKELAVKAEERGEPTRGARQRLIFIYLYGNELSIFFSLSLGGNNTQQRA